MENQPPEPAEINNPVVKEAPIIQAAYRLAQEVHEGINLGGKPLIEHSLRIADDPDMGGETPEESTERRLVALLHDGGNPKYIKDGISVEEVYRRMKEIGCSPRVIGAVQALVRPEEGWQYDDWISFLGRDELTRLTKIADSKDVIAHVEPEAPSQGAAWQRTLDRLSAMTTEKGYSEPPEVTDRITASMQVHPLPNIAEL